MNKAINNIGRLCCDQTLSFNVDEECLSRIALTSPSHKALLSVLLAVPMAGGLILEQASNYWTTSNNTCNYATNLATGD